MPEYRGKDYSGIGIFAVSQLCQSGIGTPASGSLRYRWSRISPALPSYEYISISIAARVFYTSVDASV
jgi:hypothetical protein